MKIGPEFKPFYDWMKGKDLGHSLGFAVDKDGNQAAVRWGSPAFQAGLVAGTRLIAVNGLAYEPERLLDAVKRAKGTSDPIELLVRNEDRFRTVRLDYHEGLRYPHLERDPSQPARLDDILAPRP